MIRLVLKHVKDDETNISANVNNKTISIHPNNGNNGFVFKDSKIETVEMIANVLLRFVEFAKQEALNSEYKTTNE